MPHAELHGKLSSTGSNASDRLEDLLTSDVFGRLRYLNPASGLLPVLTQATNAFSNQPLQLVPPVSTLPIYRFWPRLDVSEPDVLLEWQDSDGVNVKVLVECKHLSGKSGSYSPNEEDPKAAIASADADQLRREYQDLLTLGGQGVLLYITGHRVPPLDDLEATVKALQKKDQSVDGFRASAYWLSWLQIWATLRDQLGQSLGYEQLVLQDMVDLLAHKGYRTFQGLTPPAFSLPLRRTSLFYQAGQRFYRWAPPWSSVPAAASIFYDGRRSHE